VRCARSRLLTGRKPSSTSARRTSLVLHLQSHLLAVLTSTLPQGLSPHSCIRISFKMWLLDTKTIQLTQFLDERKAPFYAILSHTWGDEEISFHDIQNPDRRAIASKAGFKKIEACCKKAAEENFDYVWVDTCCIDKTNSAELSEAINSMFRWYGNSVVCYAYLVDVESDDDPAGDYNEFRKSRWFTRGWTLQELLAPRSLVFFNNHWEDIGTKKCLEHIISEITGISGTHFRDGYWPQSPVDMGRLKMISTAQKMFWASYRETTRVEDEAYCLMGLFDINMPMIYGEGPKAFQRLQLEIIKSSQDQSIFCWWRLAEEVVNPLANSPEDFQLSGSIVCGGLSATLEEYSMTQKGLKITLPLMVTNVSVIGLLNCYRLGDYGSQIAIRFWMNYGEGNAYSRRMESGLESFKYNAIEFPIRSIYIQEIKHDNYISLGLISPENYHMLELRHHNESLSMLEIEGCAGSLESSHIFASDVTFQRAADLPRRYTTHLCLHNEVDSPMPGIIMFQAVNNKSFDSVRSTNGSDEQFAVLIGFISCDSPYCFFELIIPDLPDNGKVGLFKNIAVRQGWYHCRLSVDDTDRRWAILQKGTSIQVALKDIIINGRVGYLLDVKSEKEFEPVLVSNICCLPASL
jgi:hypothetical protein